MIAVYDGKSQTWRWIKKRETKWDKYLSLCTDVQHEYENHKNASLSTFFKLQNIEILKYDI